MKPATAGWSLLGLWMIGMLVWLSAVMMGWSSIYLWLCVAAVVHVSGMATTDAWNPYKAIFRDGAAHPSSQRHPTMIHVPPQPIHFDIRDDDILVLTCSQIITDDHRERLKQRIDEILATAGRKSLILEPGISIQFIHRSLTTKTQSSKIDGV